MRSCRPLYSYQPLYGALILVAPFGTCRLQWAIYITLCIESEGLWVYDMVNCSHLSCLEKGRFSSIAHLPAAQPCACWEDLMGGYFCILEFRGSGPHSNSTHTCSPLVQLGRELHAIIKASLSSVANQKELWICWHLSDKCLLCITITHHCHRLCSEKHATILLIQFL